MNQIKVGSILSYISIFISNIVGIVYTPFMLRMLGQSEFGIYSLVMTIVSYLALMDFGFGLSIVRYTSLYIAAGKTKELSSLYGLFIMMYSIVGLASFIFGLIIYYNVEHLYSNSLSLHEITILKKMLFMIIIYITLSFPFSVFSAIVTSHEKFIFQKSLNIIRAILIPALMIPLLLMGYKSVALIMVFIFIGVLISLLNIWFCFEKLKINVAFSGFDKRLFYSILGFSTFIFLKNIFERVYWSSGQLMLGAALGSISVAVFSIAIQIKGYYETFAKTIGNLFLPHVIKTANTYEFNEFNLLFIKVGRILFHISGFILIVYILIGDRFIYFWAGNDYTEAYIMSLLIMIPSTVPLIQILASQLLQALNKLKFQVIVFGFIAINTLGLNYVFIQHFGNIGPAMSLFVSIIIGEVLVMNIYYSKIGIDIKGFWFEIFKITIPMCSFLFLLKSFLFFLAFKSFIDLIVYILIVSLLYLVFIYFTGMNQYEKKTIKNLIKRVN